MLGAYQEVPAFAYPGWRLTVPGGPAGGHYKGFTHNYSAGTWIDPADEYEFERAAGVSAHDAVHATPRNPRGVYRSSAEVPPRPNASGSAHTYRGVQTRRHAGTSVAPGSFPAEFFDTNEDQMLAGLGLLPSMIERNGGSTAPIYSRAVGPAYWRPPNTVAAPAQPTHTPVYSFSVAPAPLPSTGATSVVNQPPPLITPPAPSVSAPPSFPQPLPSAPPVSPAPAPTVASPAVVPANDGSGNYIRVSDGSVLSPSQVYENPATGQLQAMPSASSGFTGWLTENSVWSAVPNWVLLAGAGVLVASMKGGRR